MLPVKGINKRVKIRARKTKTEIRSMGLNIFVGFEEIVDILKISLYIDFTYDLHRYNTCDLSSACISVNSDHTYKRVIHMKV